MLHRMYEALVHTQPHQWLRFAYSFSSLVLKVCQTLKNRSRNVRDVARDTLVKMAAALGPSYLPYIIREMKDLLTRGYQVGRRRLVVEGRWNW